MKKTSIPWLLTLQKYGEGSLYAAFLLHMQRGNFQIQASDQLVTKGNFPVALGLHLTLLQMN